MVYERFVKQLDGCSLCGGKSMGGLDCTCAAEAMWLFRASQGRVTTTACHVRDLTDDCVSGTNLEQMEKVSAHYGLMGGMLYRPTTFDRIADLVRGGRFGAIIQIDYSPLVGTRFDCFGGGFRDAHALYLSGGTTYSGHAADPGADGRRTGIPHGYQDYPWSLLRNAAGMLQLGNGETVNSEFGAGRVYAYLTPADPVVSTTHYRVTITGPTRLYETPNGVKDGSVSVATYICTRSKVAGLWWYRILPTAATANHGRYFKPTRYTKVVVL